MYRLMHPATMVVWGILLLCAAAARGQTPPAAPLPPASPGLGVMGGGLSALTRQLHDRVRALGDVIAVDLGKTSAGPVLLQDARELAQAVDEFSQSLRAAPDALRRRQLYSGVDASWHHLRAQLGRPGTSSPGVDAAAKQVTETDAQLHAALGLNAFPMIHYGNRPSPAGMAEIQRLARALVDRAEALLVVAQADIGGPPGVRLSEEVTRLVQAADAFHDGIDIDARIDDLARNGFAGVTVGCDNVAAYLARIQVTPRVRAAWQSVRTSEALIRQALKLPMRDADQAPSIVPVEGRTPLLALADRLVAQADDFLVVFTPEARNVTEGGYFIADARRLRGAAAAFRAAVPGALDVSQLASAFIEVDALWEVLARRTNRIAQGRGGSNVQRIEGMGQTVAEIHRLLGMPGTPAAVGPFGG